MKEIGGYIELGLKHSGREVIGSADIVFLKNGRSSFHVILKETKPSKVYLPYYLCAEMRTVLHHIGVEYELYELDNGFDPIFDIDSIGANEMFYICEYFGLNSSTIQHLSSTLSERLVIDSTQALRPVYDYNGSWRFNSLRKYFGVPDGSILVPPYQSYVFSSLPEKSNTKVSLSHLVKRLEYGASTGYEDYVRYETDLGMEPELMSKTSNILLSHIDYENVRVRREGNYSYLHERLGGKNRLDHSILQSTDKETFKFMYPYLPKEPLNRQRLIDQKIYVPQLWPDLMVDDGEQEYSYSKLLTRELIPLPIDQRYGVADMEYMLNVIDGIS